MTRIQRTVQKCLNEKKKCLNDPDNHNDVVSLLEQDILECEVKWTLGSITMNKASRSDGIPAELLKNPKRLCC